MTVGAPHLTIMRRLLKWTGRSLLGLAGALIVIAVGGWFWARASLPNLEGHVELRGLEQPIEVLRDADGVPHVFAADWRDAAFALGYLHAQDRLFQMEFQRRLGAGRLAEIGGAMLLPLDRWARTMGIRHLAEESYRRLPDDMRAELDAYARGVNAFLDTRDRPLPPEFTLFAFTPEPWAPADSLMWGRLMGLALAGNRRVETMRARLADRLSPERFADLFTDEGATGAISLPAAGAVEDRVDVQPGPLDPRAIRLLRTLALEPLIPGLFGPIEETRASNGWVIDGARSATGKPMLVNDPHLGLGAPGFWYLARLVTPMGERVGATVAGVPLVVLGHNGRVAWGMTTTGADTNDLYVTATVGGDAYATPDGPRPFTTREETIQVRFGADVTLAVRATRHGPVVSDHDENARAVAARRETGAVVSLASTALAPDDRSAEALFLLNRADDAGALRAALGLHGAPVQTVVYADVLGRAGMVVAGRVPVRAGGATGLQPADGATGVGDWLDWVPAGRMPHGPVPPGGWLVNANNRSVGPAFPFPLGRDTDTSYRADRILELLAAEPTATLDGQERHLRDVHSGMAAELLPLMLPHVGDGPVERLAHDLLRDWDRAMARDRPEPLIFMAWLRQTTRDLLEPALGGEGMGEARSLRPKLVARALAGPSPWCTEGACGPVAAAALRKALADLAGRYGDDPRAWRWGAAHVARHAHPAFGRIPVLRDLFDVRIATDGGDDTVNRGAMRLGDNRAPFTHVHGAGLRAVYDLDDLSRSRFGWSVGQSGHPLSPHFADLAARWRDGQGRTVAGDPARLKREGARALMLAPAMK